MKSLLMSMTLVAILLFHGGCRAGDIVEPSEETVLITLGTRGGPLPTQDRSQSANLLVVNGALYLIDAGDNVTRRIVQSGYDFKKVEQVFLTHLHSDHTAGLVSLLGAAWDYQRRTPIDVYGAGVEKLVEGAILYLTPNAEIRASTGKKTPLEDIVLAREIRGGLIYQDCNIAVTAVENAHFHFADDSPAKERYRSYAYRFETPSRSIVFTGDTGWSRAVVELASGADILVTSVGDPDAVIELAKRTGVWDKRTREEQVGISHHLRTRHMSAEEIGKMAAEAKVKSVILTHLVTTVTPNDKYERYISRVKKHFSGSVVVAEDLMRF